ncbi:hypothetical protein ABA45_10655 [Marinobacter psychrophilus]|jgi:hypothetical protein|uniref:DUF6285 domain-containing protein n=1 Tax=Marinobacter psychrophilus TaxID=330734 RepID=A0A0H4I4Z8_9GAMM|nr:DUF6285 domain-containing protein [Marinobacter psychrophilus]AKO52805.1 hypothetical protein ABA45_10655 [Marinobacter psychrophilus]
MNRPDAPELLAAARETLMNDVFPSIPEHLRYEVRMIASAMGIAAREATAQSQTEAALFSRVLPESIAGSTSSSDDARRTIAKAIRAGVFDTPGAQQERLQVALAKTVYNALMISNPKAAQSSRGQR